jgi:hypothetical protein
MIKQFGYYDNWKNEELMRALLNIMKALRLFMPPHRWGKSSAEP